MADTRALLRETIAGILRELDDDVADEFDPLDMGDVVFSPNRTDARTDEPNTHSEDRLFRDIRGWVKDYEPFNPESVDLLDSAMEDPKYSDYVRRAGPGIVFRGMSVKKATLARWTGMDPDDMAPKGEAGTTYVLRPEKTRGGLVKPLSFSKESHVARAFAETSMYTKVKDASTVFVMWSADTAENDFLDLESMQARTTKLAPSGTEAEVISLHPVKTDHVWWWTDEEQNW